MTAETEQVDIKEIPGSGVKNDASTTYFEVALPGANVSLYVRPVDYPVFTNKVSTIFLYTLLTRAEKRQPKVVQLSILEKRVQEWGEATEVPANERDKTKANNKLMRGFLKGAQMIVNYLLTSGHVSVAEEDYGKLKKEAIAAIMKEANKKRGTPSQKEVASWIVMNKGISRVTPDESIFMLLEFIRKISSPDFSVEKLAEAVVEEVEKIKSEEQVDESVVSEVVAVVDNDEEE